MQQVLATSVKLDSNNHEFGSYPKSMQWVSCGGISLLRLCIIGMMIPIKFGEQIVRKNMFASHYFAFH